jgi:hypothetical protein
VAHFRVNGRAGHRRGRASIYRAIGSLGRQFDAKGAFAFRAVNIGVLVSGRQATIYTRLNCRELLAGIPSSSSGRRSPVNMIGTVFSTILASSQSDA